jgi:hypothetical protein
VACAGLLGISWLLSVGPALGAGNGPNGNNASSNGENGSGSGTSGNVKVHDAATGLEASGTDNEPHVCDFWLSFTFDAPFEAGTWVVVSWAPTGDGSTVASGAYDTGGDGVDSSNVIEVTAGHYRVEWAATGASSSKKKTFWVDAGCDETPADEAPADEPPADEPPADEPPADEPPAEEDAIPAEEPASPAEDLGPPADEPPFEDPAPPVEESIQLVEEQLIDPLDDSEVEEPAAPAEEQAVEEPAVEEPAVEEPAVEEPAAEEPAIDEAVAPSDESPATPVEASSEEDPAPAEDPGATQAGPPPVQDELGNIAGAGEPTMSDTATADMTGSRGPVAAIGVLMLIVLHGIARLRRAQRSRIGTDA